MIQIPEYIIVAKVNNCVKCSEKLKGNHPFSHEISNPGEMASDYIAKVVKKIPHNIRD